MIEEFMARVAALPVAPSLPDPAYLWWKVELLRRAEARRHVRRPIDLMQPVQIAAGLVAVVTLLYSSLSAVF